MLRMSVSSTVIRESDKLNKNLDILVKLGTRISWHYEKVGIANGQKWIITTPQSARNYKVL